VLGRFGDFGDANGAPEVAVVGYAPGLANPLSGRKWLQPNPVGVPAEKIFAGSPGGGGPAALLPALVAVVLVTPRLEQVSVGADADTCAT